MPQTFCHEMTIFELNFLASPAGGLVGGLLASADHGVAYIAGAAVGGIAVGFALYFGIIGFGTVVEKIANRGMPQDDKRLDRGGTIMGVLVLPANSPHSPRRAARLFRGLKVRARACG